ncbi:MAG: lysophospholipid acyltransferase family protein [Lamprocystis purpurea]|nr:lysophospholipid acyltransferase family protein [Lamprocystis purpurea]
MKAKQLSRWRRLRVRATEGMARALAQLTARLPLSLIHRVGAAVGWVFIHWPNRQRRNALINIGLCLPELSPPELIRLRDRNLVEFGKTYLEIGHLWLRPVEQVHALVREVRGAQLLQRQPGKGLIVLSPHLGAWELAGLHLARQGPTAIFYKPQRYLDDLILAARRRSGAELAPITARGIRVLVQALERGDYVGVLPDQEPKENKGACFAPLFGIPAFTMLLVQRLAERLPDAAGFRMHCLPAPEGIDSADELTAATALNRGIEQCVRTCPEQYVWPYKRFRRRPDDRPGLYDGPLSDAGILPLIARRRSV